VDGASGAEHDLAVWEDEAQSPVGLAAGGTLALLDVAALPEQLQQTAVRQLSLQAAAAADSNVCAPGLIVSVHAPLQILRDERRLTPGLLRLLADDPVEIPPLVARAEDLRSLILDALARAGMRSIGEPLGIDGSALQLMLEHTWPGNDVELMAVIARVARLGTHRVITAADLATAGFVPETEFAPSATPLPVVTRRRPRTRTVRRR
jgi:DNA-binding NtrC family response regulator